MDLVKTTASRFPFVDPITGRRLAVSELVPDDFTASPPVVPPWADSLLLEDRQNRHPWEIREYTLDGLRLQMALDTVETLECRAEGRWHGGRFAAGNTLIIPSQMPTGYRWRESNFRVADVIIAPKVMASALPDVSAAEVPYLHAVADVQIERMISVLRDELTAGCPGGRLLGESLALVLVTHILGRYALPRKSRNRGRKLEKAELQRVVEYLAAHLMDDVSLDSLASAAGYSPFHFCRLFKNTTGLTPHQFVIRERVERAKGLLLSGRMSVTETAAAVGFCNATHLSRYMKRLLDVTPSQLRDQSR